MLDEFGSRMKEYESAFTKDNIPGNENLIIRLDGKNFSKLTKTLQKPFDLRFSEAMQDTALTLSKEFKCDLAYTQSDEITLVFLGKPEPYQHIFNGKIFKLNSIFAAYASVVFNKWSEGMPVFDCRAWTVPDHELSNTILWRIHDAKRNSVSACYRWILNKKKMPTQDMMKIELKENGYLYDDLSNDLKYGKMFDREFKPLDIVKFIESDWQTRQSYFLKKEIEYV